MIALKSLWPLAKESVTQWSDDYAPSMGAALAYYTIFSIAPLIVIAVAVAGFVFGAEAARGEIFAQLRGMIGDDGAAAVQGLVKSTSEPGKGTFAAIAGVVTLLLGATTVFGELQSDLDRIWDVPTSTGSGIKALLRGRMLSFGMILGIGFLLLVSLVLSAGLSALARFWDGAIAGGEVVLQAVNFFVSFAIITGLFAMIYKLLPRCRIEWRDVWVGATVTSLLFAIGKLLIGLYLGKSGVASGFGAAGSLVVVLLWVYYSAQIFLLGAEFTKTYAHRHGSRIGSVTHDNSPTPRSATAAAAPAHDLAATMEDLVSMDRAKPPHARARGKEGPSHSLATFRIAAGVAATLGLLAGEMLDELRRRRPGRMSRRH